MLIPGLPFSPGNFYTHAQRTGSSIRPFFDVDLHFSIIGAKVEPRHVATARIGPAPLRRARSLAEQ